MTSHTLPIELQDSHAKLQALRQPHEPYHENTVKSSEAAMEGDSFWEFVFAMLLCAVLPWWAEDIIDGMGGDDNKGEKDYFILTPTVFVVSIVGFILSPMVNGWRVFSFAMILTVLTFLGLILFHLIFHKCITMYVYNHVFRRSWMREMHARDEKAYLADVEAYPQLLQEYEIAKKSALYDANIALSGYNATSPDSSYKIGPYGFEEISFLDKSKQIAGEQVRGLFKKLTSKLPSV